jgi:hypothetical protein
MANSFYSDGYRPLRSWSLFAIGGLALSLVCDAFAFIFGMGGACFPLDINLDDGSSISIWLGLVGIVGLLNLPVYIFTIITFLVWQHRAYKNLPALKSRNLQNSPGWAVGWWFIPFANLWMPFQVIREMWNESDPDFEEELGFLSNSYGTPLIVGWWWAFWIIGNIVTNISGRVAQAENSVENGTFWIALIVEGVFGIVAAYLAIEVVRGITKRQEMRFSKISNRSQYLPPSPPTFD